MGGQMVTGLLRDDSWSARLRSFALSDYRFIFGVSGYHCPREPWVLASGIA